MSENKKEVTISKVTKQSGKPILYAFGGMILGKAASHFLDKVLTSQPVQGLVGVEMSENVSKYVKPLVVTTAGAIGYVTLKDKNMKFASIGFASMGVADLSNVVFGKDYLSGLSGGDNFGNQDFEIIDAGLPVPPAAELNLPALTGAASFGAEVPTDDYQENAQEEYDNADIPVYDNELEAA